MFDLSKVKGILFDYGGTIDSNGMHWAEVIWMAYEACKVPVSKEVFREAYVIGERVLGKNPVIKPYHTFLNMLCVKCDIQIQWLVDNKHLGSQNIYPDLPALLGEWCYNYACRSIDAARPVLEELGRKYPMVLVSNFYGNIEAVLKDFRLDHLFPVIIESAVVGVRKPDPAIFQLGIDAIKLPAANCVVIGDSHDKDIIPGREVGCQTIWIKSIGWKPYKGDETADAIIEDFKELDDLFKLH